MKTLRTSVALAAAVLASTYATASSADQVTTSTTTTQPAPQTTYVQPAPQPQVVVQQPTQPQVVGTTTTTAAPYGPAPAAAEEERSIETRPHKTLLKTGIIVSLASYAGSAIAGAASQRDEDKLLFVPLVGPWLDLGNRDCDARECGKMESTNRAMIATAGAFQLAGTLLIVGSFLVPESSTVRRERRVLSAPKPPTPEVAFTPVSYVGGAGFGAVGRF